jgi:hypothetical protein
MPSLPGPPLSIPNIALDSTPRGADASFANGTSCTTPCSLPAPGSNGTFYVNFVLEGYARQSVQVRVSSGREHWYSNETTTIEPSPVVAHLEAIPPPQPEKKKKRPQLTARPAPQPTTSAAASAPRPDPPAPEPPPLPSPAAGPPPR